MQGQGGTELESRGLWSHDFNLGTEKIKVEVYVLAPFLVGAGVRVHRCLRSGSRDSKPPVMGNPRKLCFFLWGI